MIDFEELLGNVAQLKTKSAELQQRKDRMIGQREAKLAQLKTLVEEIRDKGYDPARLKQVKQELLSALVGKFETMRDDLEVVERQLDEYEAHTQ